MGCNKSEKVKKLKTLKLGEDKNKVINLTKVTNISYPRPAQIQYLAGSHENSGGTKGTNSLRRRHLPDALGSNQMGEETL